MSDFEQILAKYRPMLPAWYAQAVKDLKTMSGEDISLFQVLLQAAKDYGCDKVIK